MQDLLIIDTTSERCSVGIKYQDKLSIKSQIGFKNHGKAVLAFADELLKQKNITLADVDAIVFAKGPGSFTGLRIAACVAQGLAVSNQLPVVGISSLQALAQGAYRKSNCQSIYVLNDARMNEVFHASYQLKNGLMQLVGQEQVGPISSIEWSNVDDYVFVGSGLEVFKQEIPSDVFEKQITMLSYSVEIQDLISLALVVEPQTAEMALPSYVRNNVAHKKIVAAPVNNSSMRNSKIP